MKSTNVAAESRVIAEIRSSPERNWAVIGREAAASGTKSQRRYQRPLSKESTKLSKYRLNGKIQRNGMAAIFSVKWLVTASSKADGQAVSAIQSRRSERRGPAICGVSRRVPRVRKAMAAHTTTKTQYDIDHVQACWRLVRYGSTSTG